MSITPVWTNLRDWRGSQAGGFEELCCQLAACEPAPAGAEYRRVGTPDAGVECIWRDPSGSVRAWQDRKSTRLNSSHPSISYAVFCLKKKKQNRKNKITYTE